MKYCQHCGAEVNEEAVICVKCGCSVGKIKQKKLNSKNFFIGGFISLGLSVISFFIHLYLNLTRLPGTAVYIMREYGDYAGLAAHQSRLTMETVFLVTFLVLLFVAASLITVGIIRKRKVRIKENI